MCLELQQEYYTSEQIAPVFGLKPGYLKHLRHIRKGPRYHKLEKLVLYKYKDVKGWLEVHSQVIDPAGIA